MEHSINFWDNPDKETMQLKRIAQVLKFVCASSCIMYSHILTLVTESSYWCYVQKVFF
jgi:hypothetical protein